MDHRQIIDDALASPEGQRFQADYAALVQVEGFEAAAPGAFDWTKAIAIVTQLAPIILTALSGGMTPALLIGLLPGIIKAFVPGISDSLVTLLQNFLTTIIGKIPATT